MQARLVSTLLLAAVFGAACDRDPVAELPALNPVSVSPQNSYAGGRVTIRSGQFAQLPSIEILADTIPLNVAVRGGDSVVVEIPRTFRGSFSLRLGKNGPALGAIEIAGYAGEKPTPQLLGFYLDVWPEGGRASVLATISQTDARWISGEVFQLLPGPTAMTPLVSGFRMSDPGSTRLPGRTPDQAVLVLQPFNTLQPAQVWRMMPTPHVIDTLSFSNFRHAALFNDSVRFAGAHHWIETYRSGRLVYRGTYEETHEVIISPTRDRATLRVNGSPTGPPVFNTTTGDTAYHVRPLFRSYGAAFSQNGDTLWMLGVTRAPLTPAMVMLNARTGAILKQVEFPGVPALAMRRDPAGGRLFVFAYAYPQEPSQTELLVVDDRTLQIIGRVNGPICDRWCDWAVVAVGIDGVFVVQPRAIYEFDYQSNED
jgi:hypothetical protein